MDSEVSSSSSQSFPGFEAFYRVRDPLEDAPYRGRFHNEDDLAVTRGELRPRDPVLVTHAAGGSQVADFIWTTSVYPMIISARAHAILRQNGFTGWGTYPVRVIGKDGTEVAGYVGLSVVGRCGPRIRERSGRRLKEFPGRTREVKVGWFFEESSWDGTDFFTPAVENAAVLVHERVMDCLVAAEVRNVKFERLDQIEYI